MRVAAFVAQRRGKHVAARARQKNVAVGRERFIYLLRFFFVANFATGMFFFAVLVLVVSVFGFVVDLVSLAGVF